MLDPAIQSFLLGRVDKRVELKCKDLLKKNGEIQASEKLAIENAARDEFSLKNWLLYCAKNASGVSMTTHPCKYSHPDAQTTPIYFSLQVDNKGFVQSNLSADTDVIFSTAAYMPIYSFLKLILIDGEEVLEHLLSDTDIIRKQFSVVDDYELLKSQLLEVISSNTAVITSEKVKQVYFPVRDDYHLLSIVSSSLIMFDLKKRVKHINSYKRNEPIINAKKGNLYFEGGYKSIFDLTLQGHVKSNPQCISQLNKDNFGESYLLNSCPPTISKRNIYFPKNDFFIESMKKSDVITPLKGLHQLFKTDLNNIKIRDVRDYRLQDLIDRIIEKMWAIRAVSIDQYYEKSSSLSQHQIIWLHQSFISTREESKQWLEKLIQEMSSWIIKCYENVLGKQAFKVGETELKFVTKMVSKNSEAFQ